MAQSTVAAGEGLRLCAESLTLNYGGRNIVENLDFEVPQGRVTSIIGPNGCGKSTVLRGFSRLLKPASGRVHLDGKDLARYGSREFARRVGLLPQDPVAPEGITVVDLVSRGRYPYQGMFSKASREDDDAVAWALEATHTDHLASCQVAELSGGQRQRVWIAMALAQETDVLLLDEPTTYLDLAHQVELLDLVVELNRTRGTTMVLVLHELNLAARCADHLVAMKDGAIALAGDPRDVITRDHLADVFGLDALVSTDDAGSPVVVPVPRKEFV
ncbi:ABC transporter ATP-binding protein [Kocuria sp. HSID16901]|uniref:ABC transporter ATP-binding protein n=1 Tax=Kocuria sp. HSID16901 TaxID=2419505 RepID=UPI00065FAC1E|nr:ABC transporter ATP-binding protein [Kocuria sp. HSID16901]MCT1368216.1 ABC transporter ATP-binding protein [Rothia sp. p3-SID1597]RUQ23553.1 ABC transporter ATP-binding protein [Kocuria sp. HSID16901]